MRKITLLIVLSLIISANALADATMPLNFTAVNGTATVALNRVGTPDAVSLQYSTDSCTTWNTYTVGNAITIANGATVYLKATTTNSAFGAGLSYYNFSMTGTVYADGNIMSLLDQTMNRTSLSTYAFYHLFENCSTLIHAPELPATTLANHCYAHLFQNCSSLAETPTLPASSLSKSGYYKMFYGCTSLTTIPSLTATSLAEKCYKQMFDSCTSLVVNTQAPGVSWSIPGNAQNYDATSFEDMFTNTAGTMNGEPSVGTVYYIASPETRQYLNFTAVDSAATISLLAQGTPPAITLQYSVDTCSTWNTYTVGNIITIDSGATVYFKALTTNGSFGSMMGNYYFTMSGTVAAGGNIMSLLDASMTQTSVPQYAFFKLFANCASLTSAPELPATTLATYCYGMMFYDCPALVQPPTLPAVEMKAYCYREMFSGCSSLAQAPALPATSLNNGCYYQMFKECSSLTQPPTLPADTLKPSCYYGMFWGCSLLAHAPALPATSLSTSCYHFMFNNCSTLTQAPSLPATTLTDYCYSNMFNGCTSLTQPPALPATTLQSDCYQKMFTGCTSLAQAPALPADTLANGCYDNMFSGCTTLSQPPALPATTLAKSCYKHMFYDCASLSQPPSLPATSLAVSCYEYMFYRCASLSLPPALPADTLANSCYSCMFVECTSLTRTPVLSATTLAESCYQSMFEGCTSLTHAAELPADSLPFMSYYQMFLGCTTLTHIPQLPTIRVLDSFSCDEMFSGCSSLVVNTQAPGTPWSIPYTGGDTPLLDNMLAGTAGTMNDTPSVNTIYYVASMSHQVTVNINDTTMGSVSGGGTHYLGDTITLVATPAQGHHFVSWSNDSTTSTLTFILTQDTTLTATFAANQHTVTVSSNDTSMGNVTGSGTYNYGDTITLTATPAANHHFVSWSNGATTTPINIILTQDTTLTANFAINQHTVTVNSNNPTMGSVTGSGTYNYGDTITLTATPAANHHFVSWSNGASTLTITFALTQDTTLTATFEADAFTGTVGDNLFWSIDSISGELLFSGAGSTPDYSLTYHAPWYYKRPYVTHVTMPAGVISRLGDYAFDDFQNLYYAELNTDSLGASIFNGCPSFTLCYSETNALANSNTMDGCTSSPILIAHDYQWYKHTYTDSLALALNIYPYRTDYTQDSLLTLNATVTLRPSIKGISVVASRQEINGTPLNISDDCNIIWKDSLVAPLIYEFYSQGVGYFGKNSFVGCSGIHNITASPKYWSSSGSYAYAHLDSIHADAFDSIYPDIVDLYEETKYQPANVNHYKAQKPNLNQTLLYVPDTLAATGKSMWAQYTATSFWNDNFADISNKGLVDTQYVDTAYADIYFYYQEAFDSVPVVEYHLILYKIGGTDTADVYFSNDTSFVIARIPRVIVIVDSVTGGTTTITISIDHAVYNPNIQEVNIHMEHLAENSSYSITLSPLDESGNALVIDTCTMTTTTVTSLPEIQYDENENFFPTANTDVYLITGQYIGKYTFSLPPGVYLMREDKRWYKFAVSRQ